MNFKRYFFSVLAVFFVYEILSYLINSLLLKQCYVELEPLWRKEMMDIMWLMYFTDFLFSILFVSIYTRWSKKFTIASGLFFGFIVGLMMNTTGAVNQWIMYPITNHLMVLWVVFGLFQFVICGFFLGLSYKPRKKIEA